MPWETLAPEIRWRIRCAIAAALEVSGVELPPNTELESLAKEMGF